jgi:hypothetical protein
MIPKYSIEYRVNFRRNSLPHHHSTDDPVAAEEFLAELLERGYLIDKISHEGLPLEAKEFDRLVKAAAQQITARLLCASLRIKTDEERYRFGFSA